MDWIVLFHDLPDESNPFTVVVLPKVWLFCDQVDPVCALLPCMNVELPIRCTE